MQRQDFKKLLSQLSLLTHLQKQKLQSELRGNSVNKSLHLIESNFEKAQACPHCSHHSFSRWGKSGDLQRYRCKQCKKTFNALTGSPLTRLRHKELWMQYVHCLNEGMSVRKAAHECGIDKTTSFRWRHRFLQAPAENKCHKMTGIVEADETFFTESRKGDKQLTERPARKRGCSSKKLKGKRVPVLIVRDRNATEADFVLKEIEKNTIHACLRPLMGEEVILCSDGNSIYKSFAKTEKIPHKRIIGIDKTYVVDEIFHIQNLNAYISRLKLWMARFHGVATKYLTNYLGWRRMLEKQKDNMSDEFCFTQSLIKLDQQLIQT